MLVPCDANHQVFIVMCNWKLLLVVGVVGVVVVGGVCVGVGGGVVGVVECWLLVVGLLLLLTGGWWLVPVYS